MWSREFQAWQKRGRSIQIIRTGKDLNQITGDVIIVSYAMAHRITGRTFDLLICDEAQALKSASSVRTRAVYGRGGLASRSQRIWLLSGTLMPNHPGEVWPHYRCLFGGELTYPAFVDRYCMVKQTPFGQQITGANPARTAELAAFLRPHVLQRRQQDVLADLPPLRWGHVPVTPATVPPQPDLTVQEAAILGKLERDEALSVVEQMHLGTLRRWTGIAKAPAVVELLRTELEQVNKIVVFAVHRAVIAAITEGLGSIAAAINGDTPQSARQALLDAFQNTDQPRILVLQINVAGTALTLHRASRVIFAETTWTPADVVQAAKRCHRIGQQQSVLASIISLAGSIDERVNGVIKRKAAELAALENQINKGRAA
jgi:SWI/SNF-related matrix-associated actin-dependent regulator of chromatin subfamily A-like protein 1